MSEQMETILRKSLDEVDRIRKRQFIGLAILLLVFFLHAASVIATLHASGANSDLRVALIASVEIMVFTVGFSILGVGLFISRMTSKILKAIELSSRV